MLATFSLSIEVLGPLLTRDSAPGSVGIDALVARHDDGTPYVAGSHVLGKSLSGIFLSRKNQL